jgi:hypothetical protein
MVADLHRLDPKQTLSALRKTVALRPATYNEWFESKLVPAWRKAALPEKTEYRAQCVQLPVPSPELRFAQ